MERDYREDLAEVRGLLKKKHVEDALDILDGVNWRKVRNINLLLEGARLYDQAGKLEQARDLLELAHERSPIGRKILFELCQLCLRMDDYEEAKAYYDDFVDLAPHDYQRYILKYYISRARGADDYALIAVLEELKENELIEEWAYELACLYHRTSQVDKCIDLCDEIALYFGEGAYVEKALELKMLYHPLNKEQEYQYRHEANHREGLTEVRAREDLQSGEYIARDMTIPKVELPPERFNTINLQAEIKKNIDEIMNATAAGEVSETMETLKDLVGEIPYLQVPEEKEEESSETPVEETEEKQEIGVFENYQRYLSEEFDGQMSLDLPDIKQNDQQIDGQMTIQDVMDNWERTRRAAEAALMDAETAKLEKAKESALREANYIMDRLETVAPRLDAGVAPQELLKEEYLGRSLEDIHADEIQQEEAQIPEVSEEVVAQDEISEVLSEPVAEAQEESTGFAIPKVDAAGGLVGVGLEVPVVAGVAGLHPESAAPTGVAEPEAAEEASQWTPEQLDEEERLLEEEKQKTYKEASNILAGVNDMLQRELDRISLGEEFDEDPDVEDEDLKQLNPTEAELEEREVADMEAARLAEEAEAEEDVEEEVPEERDDSMRLAEAITAVEVPEEEELPEEEIPEEEIPEEEISAEIQEEEIPEEISEQEEVEEIEEVEEGTPAVDDISEGETSETEDAAEADDTDDVDAEELPEVELSEEELLEEETEEEEETPIETEDGLKKESSPVKLTSQQRDLFEFFMPIEGMEKSITRVISNVKARLEWDEPATAGNVIVIGAHGSGKTTLSKGMIQVLQENCGKPGRNIGRIDGDKLNNKNIEELYSKICGGCLVIERAGEINENTARVLSGLMEQDKAGTVVFIEDTKRNIDHALSLYDGFAKKFTASVTIPTFSVDELVSYGRRYAQDNGYDIEEMAVLAMYDRINKIQRLDRPTYLSEIEDIMDEAISKSSRKGFFHRKRVNEDGNAYLVEKDFL